MPPQPSLSPHFLPLQLRWHTHLALLQVWPVGQGPLHLPPQPLGSPQALPLQLGTQLHLPFLHCSPDGQLPSHFPSLRCRCSDFPVPRCWDLC